MYCKNCGKKVDSNDKFCSNCGTNIRQTTAKKSLAKATVYVHNIKLLDGLDNWLGEKIGKQPAAKPLLAASELLKVYKTLNLPNNKYIKAMPADTRRFIFGMGFKDVLPVGLNTDELQKLSPSEQNKLATEVIPKLDKLVVDILVIGYVYRVLSSYVNQMANFSEFNGLDNPSDALRQLLSGGVNGDMFADVGWGVPYAITTLMGDGGLSDTIYKNMVKALPMAKLLPEGQILILLSIGWCTARFDLARKMATG